MNLQQYIAMKQELAATITYMQALAAQVDRLEEKLNDLTHRNPVGRPRKDNGEATSPIG